MSSCSRHPCSCTEEQSLLPSRVLCALRCFLQCLLGCTVEASAGFFYLKKSKPCQDLCSAVVSLPSWRPAPLERLSQMKESCLPQPSRSMERPGDVAVNMVASALNAVWNVRTLRWNSLEQKSQNTHTWSITCGSKMDWSGIRGIRQTARTTLYELQVRNMKSLPSAGSATCSLLRVGSFWIPWRYQDG